MITMKKIAAAVIIATASTGAMAAADNFTGGVFDMFDEAGDYVGGASNVTGFVDPVAKTFAVASTTAFFGKKWTASGGTLFAPGTYTINVNGDGSNDPVGDGNVTFTVGAGQVGGNIDFAWGTTSGIDVFQVWNITPGAVAGTYNWTSTDIDNNGIPGLGMVDGAFIGFSANFNMTTHTAAVPEASTYAMMLAGLGLVGAMVGRRRKTM